MTITILFILFLVIIVSIFYRYKRCAPNQVLVIFGMMIGEDKSLKCINAGGKFVWPIIQDYKYMSLSPRTLVIPLANVTSVEDSTKLCLQFTFQISAEEGTVENAAKNLLHLSNDDIKGLANNILVSQLRQAIISLTLEKLITDSENFLSNARPKFEIELNKIGLTIININIIDDTGAAKTSIKKRLIKNEQLDMEGRK